MADRLIFIAVLLLLFFCNLYSEDMQVDITGSVMDKNSGRPLVGATVQLINNTISAITNEEGEFQLSYVEETSVNRSLKGAYSDPVFTITKGNFIDVSISEKQNITLRILDLRGKKVNELFRGEMAKGVKSIQAPVLSSGFYIFHLQTASANYTLPVISSGSYYSPAFKSSVYSPPNPRKANLELVFPDTIFVTKAGYFIEKAETNDPFAQGVAVECVAYGDKSDMVLIESEGKTITIGYADGGSMERPVFTVNNLMDYKISRTPVRQEQFEELMGFNPSFFKDLPSNPVENVTWYDAMLYCNELSKAEGLDTFYTYSSLTRVGDNVTEVGGLQINYHLTDVYRLPTEVEWEYASRGEAATVTFWGDEDIAKYVWFSENSNNRTQPVGHRFANPFGLYDMNGNVGEWCQNYYISYAGGEMVIDHFSPRTSRRTERTYRGGSYSNSRDNIRSTFRYMMNPSSRDNRLGFRVVRSME
ncbi:SUMF1/EgtB/PvdO family nonheme iron enzyme [Chitinispirillales bacterium ANBcel5]|uniref:SUMF1/EgtB/PvdO family nonheme iron enzyme n=1 Tax=Cellulosispirillum alkaliphilum TaxID=3039283 RepID=UPI002A559511|nr:SUMF1/EgtB/PvdO family nonheme iron enzyme [Chitinispirillales bacterium ANBcel5]